ncbi:MAG TPA: aldehyde dehydrogenase family protein [Vicinamibacterales bacterium]|jgi:acetaldehyde dehydrogenase (acetylating)
MAEALDRDLVSIQEARHLARRARQAQQQLAELSQEQIDVLVDGVAAAATPQAEAFARLAVDETGYGIVADKIQKNLFASERVYEYIRPMRTVGVIGRDDQRKVVEIAEPFGVVAAVVPSTNPTSTTIYKVLIALKARCAIVLSPHPSAVRCISRVAEVLTDAAQRAGAPDGSVSWMTNVSLEGTQELMKSREVALILATGGMGLVRAAYSAGKPAYGVGPGNAPAYIESSADLRKAVRDIITGKTFDNGVLCSSENSVVVDEAVSEEVRREFVAQGGYFLSDAEMKRLATALVSPQRLPNPALVGKSALYIAEQIGLTVPPDTRVLLAPLAGVGREYPLSIEKLCPVLSFYTVKDWHEGCERCKQILRYGGMGHTMAIHSRNESVILEFGLRKPAFRICVNTPTTLGSIGLTTGLPPAMTLGCGGWGGNITSDNITPRHLLNIKRLAYEIRPVPVTRRNSDARETGGAESAPVAGSPRLPQAPLREEPRGIGADALLTRIDQFLASRGIVDTAKPAEHGDATRRAGASAPAMAKAAGERPPAPATPSAGPETADAKAIPVKPEPSPVDFVCEDDVRQAMRAGTRIFVNERSIITPSARDLGEAHRVFVQADWRGSV